MQRCSSRTKFQLISGLVISRTFDYQTSLPSFPGIQKRNDIRPERNRRTDSASRFHLFSPNIHIHTQTSTSARAEIHTFFSHSSPTRYRRLCAYSGRKIVASHRNPIYAGVRAYNAKVSRAVWSLIRHMHRKWKRDDGETEWLLKLMTMILQLYRIYTMTIFFVLSHALYI